MAPQFCPICTRPMTDMRSDAKSCRRPACRRAVHRKSDIKSDNGNDSAQPEVKDSRPARGKKWVIPSTVRERLDLIHDTQVMLSRDEAVCDLRQEKDALRKQVTRLAARLAEIRTMLAAMTANAVTWKKRALEAESTVTAFGTAFRSDPRTSMILVGLPVTAADALPGRNNREGNTEEERVIAELRAEVAELRRDREEDARRIARLTGELDGVRAQIDALTAPDELPEWMVLP